MAKTFLISYKIKTKVFGVLDYHQVCARFNSFEFIEQNHSFKNKTKNLSYLTQEALRGGHIDPPPSIFLALNFYSFTDCQKLWHNCSLFVNTSFNTN